MDDRGNFFQISRNFPSFVCTLPVNSFLKKKKKASKYIISFLQNESKRKRKEKLNDLFDKCCFHTCEKSTPQERKSFPLIVILLCVYGILIFLFFSWSGLKNFIGVFVVRIGRFRGSHFRIFRLTSQKLF
jgi:hypothetical protein